MPGSAFETRCPTCRAKWRETATCARCGADLSHLMQVAAKAWHLREQARTALCTDNQPQRAVALARASCRLHTTPRGQRLLALALLATGHMVEAETVIEQVLEER